MTVGGGGSQDSLYETLKVTDSEHHDYVKGTEKPKNQNQTSKNDVKKESHKFEQMNVCTDGIGSSHNDKYHQNHTAYMDQKLNADIHRYIVIPTDAPNYRELLGCVGVIVQVSIFMLL